MKRVTAEIIEDQDISNSNVWFKMYVTHVWYVVHAVLPTDEYGIHIGVSYNKRNKTQTHIISA
jgi:ABC-type proline/glycine betaine transport system permease subunit